MCLQIVAKQKQREETIKKLKVDKDGYVKLWRVFRRAKEKGLTGQFNDYDFKEGKNTAKGDYILNMWQNEVPGYMQYTPGFHSFIRKKDAEEWADCTKGMARGNVMHPVKIKKEWITDTGIQDGSVVIISKHIIISAKIKTPVAV